MAMDDQLFSAQRGRACARVEQGEPTDVVYEIKDGCNHRMTNVAYNEVFTAWQNFNGSNWTAPLAAFGWASMEWDPGTTGWTIVDNLWEAPGVGYNPEPFMNGGNNFDESPASLMTQHTQRFRVGSAYNGAPNGIPSNPGPTQGSDGTAQGVLVQTNGHFHYLDHGNHGRNQ